MVIFIVVLLSFQFACGKNAEKLLENGKVVYAGFGWEFSSDKHNESIKPIERLPGLQKKYI